MQAKKKKEITLDQHQLAIQKESLKDIVADQLLPLLDELAITAKSKHHPKKNKELIILSPRS